MAAAGHGGQVLLSGEARYATAEVADGATFADLGEHQLKDIAQPVRLFQLCHPSLAAEFPLVRSLSAHPNNLPVQLASLIGRDGDSAAVAAALDDHRLVTISGTGGTGKTRLAVDVAAALVHGFASGCWFVDLSAVTDGDLVARELGAALALHEQVGRTIDDVVVDYMRSREALIVLDNCEQVIAAAAAVCQLLLRQCPGVKMLVTSREPLQVEGERVYKLAPLEVPDRHEPEHDALQRPSVRLFVERAVAVEREFSVATEDVPAIVEICRRVDGVPLAIELSAARVPSMSVAQIAQRLDRRFQLLTGGRRTAVARQQTLLATVSWSHDLLDGDERRLFRRLGVFVGGFSLDAAEAICAEAVDGTAAVADMIDALVAKSLLLSERRGEQRYRFLETIREFARDQLDGAGESEGLRTAHRDWFLTSAERVASEGGAASLGWFDVEHDNLREALRWTEERAEANLGIRLCVATGRFWELRSHWTEAREWLRRFLGTALATSATEVRALLLAGSLADAQSDFPDARQYYERALTAAEELHDMNKICEATGGLAHNAARVGRFEEARQLTERRLALLRQCGDKRSEALALAALADLAPTLHETLALEQGSLALLRQLDDPLPTATLLMRLGLTHMLLGDLGQAELCFSECLAISRAIGYTRYIARSFTCLAELELERGNYLQARAHADNALGLWPTIGHKTGWVDGIIVRARVATAEGDHEAAEPLLEEALTMAGNIGAAPRLAAAVFARGELEQALGRHDEADRSYRKALTAAQQQGDAALIAMCLDQLAMLSGAAGGLGQAGQLLAAADSARAQVGAVRGPVTQQRVSHLVHQLDDGAGDSSAAATRGDQPGSAPVPISPSTPGTMRSGTTMHESTGRMPQ